MVHPNTAASLEHLTEIEVIEAFEQVFGPLPPAQCCPQCDSWFLVTKGRNGKGRKVGPSVMYCSHSCAVVANR